MMRQLREIPRRMLACTAVQPHVPIALIIQCATMATDISGYQIFYRRQRLPFLILSLLDFVVFVVRILIFP